MVNLDIIIPTCKSADTLTSEILDIKSTRVSSGQLLVTGKPISAACNRNIGLIQSNTDIVIMCDDDIMGFFPGWDSVLIQPLLDNPDVIMVSARIINRDGTVAKVMGAELAMNDEPYTLAEKDRILSACIAFRKTELLYDENYIGSGFEDTDYCKQLKIKFPAAKFLVNNLCKLIHINEAKNQSGKFWEHNMNYYISKWGKDW
jgi:hypothetical protein